MATNFLPLSRDIKEHWIYKDSCFLHGWLEMLFNARYANEPKTDIWKGAVYTIERGEFLYSRPSYSARLNIPEGKLRKLLDLLISENMIEQSKTLGKNKPTIYKICNYDLYNFSPSEDVEITGLEHTVNQVTTKSQPSDNQVTTKSQPLKNKDNKDIQKKEDYYVEIFDHYQSLNIKKHRALTADMKKAIDKAMSELKCDKEYLMKLLDRHKLKIESTKSNGQYAVRPRTISEFFGQKKKDGVALICCDYEDGIWDSKFEKTKFENIIPIEREIVEVEVKGN